MIKSRLDRPGLVERVAARTGLSARTSDSERRARADTCRLIRTRRCLNSSTWPRSTPCSGFWPRHS